MTNEKNEMINDKERETASRFPDAKVWTPTPKDNIDTNVYSLDRLTWLMNNTPCIHSMFRLDKLPAHNLNFIDNIIVIGKLSFEKRLINISK